MTAEALNTLKSLKNLSPSKGPDDFKKAAQKSQAFSNHLNADRPTVTSAAPDTKRNNEKLASKNHDENKQADRQNKQDIQAQRQEKKQNDRRQEAANSRAQEDKYSEDRYSNVKQSDRSANVKETNSAQDTKNNRTDNDQEANNTADNPTKDTTSAKDDDNNLEKLELVTNQDPQSLEGQAPTQETAALTHDDALNPAHLGGQTLTTDEQNITSLKSDEQQSKNPLLAQNGLGQENAGQNKAGLTTTGQDLTGKSLTGKAGLESTLGQDDQGLDTPDPSATQNKESNGFAKSLTQNTAQKDLAQNLGSQNPAANAPILAAGQQATNALLKTTSFSSQKADPALLQTLDGPDGISGLNNNLDAKANAPLTQVRTPGFTSPTQAIAVSIAQKAQNGVQQFEIRLNPPELGRVEVRLEFGKDGQMATHLIVERPETLELLNKDARQLERALNQAGINIDNKDLSFSLKDQQDGQNTQADTSNSDPKSQINASEKEDAGPPTPIYQRITPPGAIDISI